MTSKITIVTLESEDFDRIQPLWLEQKDFHVSISLNFIEDRSNTQFTDRKREITENAVKVRIDIAVDEEKQNDIGYCLSSINSENVGEIDSLYLKKNYRQQGLGKKLVQMSLNWMDANKVKRKSLYIIPENEKTLNFYKHFGFVPRSIHLMQDNIE